MNLTRLKTLADFLRIVPEESFTMFDWVRSNEKNVTTHLHEPQKTECVFAGCGMGWACQIPSFSKEGLHLYSFNMDSPTPYPKYKEHIGFHAAQAFFDISEQDADWLFEARMYRNLDLDEPNQGDDISPTEVANRIDKFILDNEEEK